MKEHQGNLDPVQLLMEEHALLAALVDMQATADLELRLVETGLTSQDRPEQVRRPLAAGDET